MEDSIGIAPGTLEALNQLPHGFIERGGYSDSLSQLHDCAVHEIHFCLTFRKHILQHAGIVLARSGRALLHQLTRITVEDNSELLRYRLTFKDEIVEQLVCRLKSCGSSVMEQGERSNRIG